jgi:outer membrane protein TolC
MKLVLRTVFSISLSALFLTSSAVSLIAEPLSLKHAVELALTHATATSAAAADEQRAFSSYLEARNEYIPQVAVGSGLGKTWGYPLTLEGSAPSIVNLTSQSAIINPALREFVRAAKTEYQTSTLQAKEQREQVIQDAVLTYLELNRWETLRGKLQELQAAASHSEEIVAQRIQQGVDSAQAGNQAKLASARVHLRVTQAEGAVDLLRFRLSHLTGLSADEITTDGASIPPLPEMQTSDDLSAKAATSNPAVLAADSHFLAQLERAKGEHRALWPTIDFAAQYALLASFNNYENYFQPGSFQQHNATIGIAMRFPFLNQSQRSRAQAADAEAIHAKKDAEAARNHISEETRRLQHSVEQLSAAQQVSELEYQISESSLDAAEIRANSGNGTIHDAEDARLQVGERFNALQDANFELERARISLLRATGELAPWVGIGK